MKIEKINSFLVRDQFIVEIITDKGISGIGQSACWAYPEAVKSIVDRFDNILIGKEGDLSIFIKFNTIDKLKKFENESNQFIEDLKKTFVFKENQYAGVFVYNYESEATSAQIKMTAPV